MLQGQPNTSCNFVLCFFLSLFVIMLYVIFFYMTNKIKVKKISMMRYNSLQSLKHSVKGIQSHLKFSKMEGVSESPSQNFLNFVKHRTLSCRLQFHNGVWGSLNLFLNYKCLKPKLKVLFASHIVAIVTNCAT